MQAMYEKHNIHVEDESMRGVQYNDIRKALTSLPGGRRLGSFLDNLTKEPGNLDLEKAFSTFALTYKPSDDTERKDGTESGLGKFCTGMAWCSSSLARKQTESDEPYATLSSSTSSSR